MPPATPSSGRQALRDGRRPWQHLFGFSFFQAEDMKWKFGLDPDSEEGCPPTCWVIWSLLEAQPARCQHRRNPACSHAADAAVTFAIKAGVKLHTCPDSQSTPIINAAQNLATGRWTKILMPKKSPSPSKLKRKGTVATSCQLLPVDSHQLPRTQDWQCQISPASTQYVPSKVQVCKVLPGAKKLPGTWSEPLVLPCWGACGGSHGTKGKKSKWSYQKLRIVMANSCPDCLGFGWERGMQNWAESHSGATASVAHHKFKGGKKRKRRCLL